MLIKHIGCGPHTNVAGMENTDKAQFDVTSKSAWAKVENNSVDAYVAHHVIQEFPWRILVAFFREIHRTLKKDGVFRIGVPYLGSGKSLDYLLSWGNINLFNKELLIQVLKECGFEVFVVDYGVTGTDIKEITNADNRPEETLFLEAFKI